ncbi:hypothetical protein, partial [Escherichia coli]|uniref:hypothetical protein n=1 Tax=Escherichia coli TaxID=562 RepID=UPI002283B843
PDPRATVRTGRRLGRFRSVTVSLRLHSRCHFCDALNCVFIFQFRQPIEIAENIPSSLGKNPISLRFSPAFK